MKNVQGYLTAAWAACYAVLGVIWALGGPGFPFGYGDPDPGVRDSTVLGRLGAEAGGPVIAVLGLTGAAAALVMARSARPARWIIGAGWAYGVLLIAVIQDMRPLVAIGRALELPILWPLGYAKSISVTDYLPWPVLNLFSCLAGGTLFVATAIRASRRRRQACPGCGRTGGHDHGLTTRAGAARWGVWAVWVAAVIPVLYALTRWAWFLGIPFGFSAAELKAIGAEAPGIWLAGALLGSFGVGGSILTLGLVQRWGEVFPRWMPGLRGKRVPIKLAVIPATVVGLAVIAAGNTMIISFFRHLGDPAHLAIIGPSVLWPLWGLALIGAAYAYYLRRRPACVTCHQNV
ncbi:hypothetical protein [Longispora albida]|uniref:hypothetical protein n=1 Tax=Longispora albida TaxID=203523 RepID=UPI000684DEDD|nr:hypothetical protein [Longispora albida]